MINRFFLSTPAKKYFITVNGGKKLSVQLQMVVYVGHCVLIYSKKLLLICIFIGDKESAELSWARREMSKSKAFHAASQ